MTDEEIAAETKDFPWWVRAARIFGVQTVFLASMLWAGYNFTDRLATDIVGVVKSTQSELTLHIKDSNDFAAMNLALVQENVNVLRAICVNSAKTEDARNRCMDFGTGRKKNRGE